MELFRLFGTIAINNSEANDAIDDTLDKAERSEARLSSVFKKIGTAVVSAFAVERVFSFGKACVEATAEVKAATSQYEQTFGDMQDVATAAITRVAEESGILKTRLNSTATSIYAFAKASGATTKEAMALMETSLQAAADSAAYYDTSLEQAGETLKSFLKGNYANDAALGVSCTEFTRNAKAAELFGKKYIDLTEIQKQQVLLKMVTDSQKLSGAMGQAARESDGYENVMGNLTESVKLLKAELGEPILTTVVIPALQAGTTAVQKITDKLKNAKKWIEDNKSTIEKWRVILVGASAAVGTFLAVMNWGTVMSSAAAAVGAVAGAIRKLNLAISSNPIGAITSLIVGLISAMVYLYNTNEDFRNKVNEVAGGILTKVQRLVSWFKKKVVPAVTEAFNRVSAIVMPMMQAVVSFIKENVIPVVQTIVGAVSTAISMVVDVIGGFFDWLSGVFASSEKSTGDFLEKIKGFFSTAWEWIKGVWEACQPFFAAVWEGVVAPVGELLSEMIGAFQEAWNVIKLTWDAVKPYFAVLWEAIKVIFSVVGDVLGWYFRKAWETIKTIWDAVKPYFAVLWEAIKVIFSVVGAVLGGFFKVAWETIKAVWDIAISYFTAVWAGIRAVFAVVGAVLSGDFSHAWDMIKNAWSQAVDFFKAVWNGISNIFGSIGKWFKDVFETALEGVVSVVKKYVEVIKKKFSNMIDKIKGFFNFSVSLPKIKLPHFSIKPSGWELGDLLKGSIPKLGIDWYAKAMDNPMVMTKPTAFGINQSGQLMVGGEKGSEVVSGTDTLMQMISKAVAEQNGGLLAVLLRILDAILAMDENMGGNLREALDGTSISVNNREFARLVKAVN